MNTNALVYATLKNAARTAAAEGHQAEAEAIFRRVAGLIERKLGKQTIEYAVCMHELADVCAEQRSWEAAETGYREALVVYTELLPNSDPAIAMLLRSLAEVCRNRGNELEARCFETEAASILARRLGQKNLGNIG